MLQSEPSGDDYITRQEFLKKAYKYLALHTKNTVSISREYRDLDTDENTKANAFFDENYTWKDQFGENYYRPGVKITR